MQKITRSRALQDGSCICTLCCSNARRPLPRISRKSRARIQACVSERENGLVVVLVQYFGTLVALFPSNVGIRRKAQSRGPCRHDLRCTIYDLRFTIVCVLRLCVLYYNKTYYIGNGTDSKNLSIGQYDKFFEEYWFVDMVIPDIIAFTISGITNIIAISVISTSTIRRSKKCKKCTQKKQKNHKKSKINAHQKSSLLNI
jgi:hypothetical protein